MGSCASAAVIFGFQIPEDYDRIWEREGGPHSDFELYAAKKLGLTTEKSQELITMDYSGNQIANEEEEWIRLGGDYCTGTDEYSPNSLSDLSLAVVTNSLTSLNDELESLCNRIGIQFLPSTWMLIVAYG